MVSDEECFIWYALAESQWKTGRLTEDVKEKALEEVNYKMENGVYIVDEV